LKQKQQQGLNNEKNENTTELVTLEVEKKE